MANKERPLPKPPNKPFGRKNDFEQEESRGPQLADRMAQAAAEGRLDEFLKKEMPDNEYARNLAGMMMGMTGMMPGGAIGKQPPEAENEEEQEKASSAEVPEDIRQAIMGGDLQGLMGLLGREHQKRNPDSPPLKQEEVESPPAQGAASEAKQPAVDKATIDALVQIASDNTVTLDWIILRAIKLYVQEYRKTGKL